MSIKQSPYSHPIGLAKLHHACTLQTLSSDKKVSVIQEPMVNTVIAEDYHTYSKAAYQQCFDRGKRTSPMTGLEIGAPLHPSSAIQCESGCSHARDIES